MNIFIVACLAVVVGAADDQLHGLLINGKEGTQIFDPFNETNVHGKLNLELQKGDGAYYSSAVINGYLAYFAGGYRGEID
jgi:hypothetical protein